MSASSLAAVVWSDCWALVEHIHSGQQLDGSLALDGLALSNCCIVQAFKLLARKLSYSKARGRAAEQDRVEQSRQQAIHRHQQSSRSSRVGRARDSYYKRVYTQSPPFPLSTSIVHRSPRSNRHCSRQAGKQASKQAIQSHTPHCNSRLIEDTATSR